VAKDYGGQTAYGAQPWNGDPWAPISQEEPPAPRPPRRAGKGVSLAVAAVAFGVAGLAVSLWGVATQVLPRQFTAQQQVQIRDWEIGQSWRKLPAGDIFKATIAYQPPSVLSGDGLTLSARRVGIARQASCSAATDAAVAAVLTRNGCQAVLRATYVDATDTYVVTVGVAVFSGSAQASAAQSEVAGITQAGQAALGVLTVPFAGTPAAWFTDSRRQLSASTSAGTYLVFYTVGYAGKRPHLPVADDSYAYSEMISMEVGVAQTVVSVLDVSPPPPHCPGTPGC
jgi:hypothetical protein